MPPPGGPGGGFLRRSLVLQFRQAGYHVVEVAAADLAEFVVAGQEQLDQDAARVTEWAHGRIRVVDDGVPANDIRTLGIAAIVQADTA